MQNWFPLQREMMESPEFKGLTHLEKVFYWLLMSEFNKPRHLGKVYYKADLDFAVQLGASEAKVRQARRKFRQRGLVKYKPGTHGKGGRGLATQYWFVRWATLPEEGSGGWFAQMPRYQYEQMVSKLRTKGFNARDIVTYVALSYTFWQCRGKYDDHRFWITKADLAERTGVPDAVACVKRLYAGWTFSEKSHLFEYEDTYKAMHFKKWATAGDPSEVEGNRNIAEQAAQTLREEARKKRKAKADALARKRAFDGTVKAADLAAIWNEYKEEPYRAKWSPRAPMIFSELANKYGPTRVAEVMRAYMEKKRKEMTEGDRRKAPTPSDFFYWGRSVILYGHA